jgi:methyl-accepting chemotaxis protein
MKKRETNRILLSTILLCSLVTATVCWIIGEKFIANPYAALIAGLIASALTGMFFYRYIDARLNNSIDFLIDKISRAANGDLTQVFKEDPEDILPYGLSFELGRFMKYLRENIGNLWKSSYLLVNQLGQFNEASRIILDKFRLEAVQLAGLSESINRVRGSLSAATGSITALRINTGGDAEMMKQILENSVSGKQHIAQSRAALENIRENTSGLRESLGHFNSVIDDFRALSKNAQSIGKAMNALSTQTSLIRLNAAIDSASMSNGSDSLEKLIDETRKISEAVTSLAVESGSMQTLTDEKLLAFSTAFDARQADIDVALSSAGRAMALLDAVSDNCSKSSSGFRAVSAHTETLIQLLADSDTRLSALADSLRDSETQFDKLCSDVNINLINFRELDLRIDDIGKTLKRVEEFREHFEIG